jgi:glycine cleavage system aminomethyltransferase T
MAYINKPFNKTGTPLYLDVRGTRLEVVVSKLPFIETKYKK